MALKSVIELHHVNSGTQTSPSKRLEHLGVARKLDIPQELQLLTFWPLRNDCPAI